MSRRGLGNTAGRNARKPGLSRVLEKRIRSLCRIQTLLPMLVPFFSTSYGAAFSAALVLLSFLASTEVTSFGQVARKGPVAAPPSQASLERIHFGDLVDVDFVGSLEFDWRGRLTSDGFLDGLERAENPIFALCRTETAVAEDIAAQYKYFLRDPKVVVRVIDRSNRALAFVTGAVRTAQRFQLRRPVNLLELIVLSGGVTETSSGEVVIFRPPNVSCSGRSDHGKDAADQQVAKPRRLAIKLADLLAGNPEANPPVLVGDIVNVVEAPPVFVIGDVASPRRMNLTPELTLSRAIASAGGASRSFSGQKARIHRRSPEPKVLEFDLRQIFEKKAQDPTLEPYDVIDVEQKGVDQRRVGPVNEPPALTAETMSRLPLRIVD